MLPEVACVTIATLDIGYGTLGDTGLSKQVFWLGRIPQATITALGMLACSAFTYRVSPMERKKEYLQCKSIVCVLEEGLIFNFFFKLLFIRR